MCAYTSNRLRVLLLMALAVLLVLPASTAVAGTKVIRLGDSGTETNPQYLAHQFFAKRVAELTNGQVEVRIFMNAQLGGHTQMNEQIASGALEVSKTAAAFMSTYDKRLSIWSLPYSFASLEKLFAAQDGKLGQAYGAVAEKYGFKLLGAEWILSAAAVGSMREDVKPLDILIPDQFFDRTRGRVGTFFGNGLVAHVSLADPPCPVLGEVLYRAGTQAGARMHRGGTYLCIEGPQFSTRAESRIYRRWGVDVIGMTNLQEAKLAREAEICYATMALVTDYDVWHETEDDVSVESVVAVLRQNVRTARIILREAVRMIPPARTCVCGHALQDAIITARERIPAGVKRDLAPIVGKYLTNDQ